MKALRVPGLALLAAVAAASTCDSNVGDGTVRSQEIIRMSVNAAGGEGSAGSEYPHISADGRFVVFESAAEDLVAPDGNGWRDIFLKDRATGELSNLTRVNPSLTYGTVPRTSILRDAFRPVVSRDGRWVAFLSKGAFAGPAGPLGPTEDPTTNVQLLDRETGIFARVVWGTATNTYPDRDCTDLSMSDDGRFLCFVSAASNLGFSNPSFIPQVYTAEVTVWPPFIGPVLTLVSRASTSSTTIANAACELPRLSRDGSTVVFLSAATNLGFAVATPHVFLGTPAGAPLEHVSVVPGTATPATGSFRFPAVSADGRYVAFYTLNTNIVPGFSGSFVKLARVDRVATSSAFVAPDPWIEPPGVWPSGEALSMSDDGRYIAYTSNASTPQTLVLDAEGVTVTASVSLSGAGNELPARHPSLSADGRWVVWDSASANLVQGDGNLALDIFLRGPLR